MQSPMFIWISGSLHVISWRKKCATVILSITVNLFTTQQNSELNQIEGFRLPMTKLLCLKKDITLWVLKNTVGKAENAHY